MDESHKCNARQKKPDSKDTSPFIKKQNQTQYDLLPSLLTVRIVVGIARGGGDRRRTRKGL